MSMSRKDYVLIATALRDAKPCRVGMTISSQTVNELEGWAQAVMAVTEALSRANSAFKPQRFLEACECYTDEAVQS